MKWNADLYTGKHAFVFQYGQNLVELLNPQPNEVILDLGCGTGELTRQIADAGAKVIGIDNSPAMIEKARKSFPDIDFHVMEATSFTFDFPFDAVFSNAVLHWISEKEKVIHQLSTCLKKGGRIVVEFGGKGNVDSIVQAMLTSLRKRGYDAHNFWYFPSVGEYATLLENAGFRVRLAEHYERPTELADSENGITDWITMFGKNFFTGVSEEHQREVLNECKMVLKATNFHDGKWYADYKRLRIQATKEGE
jgi:trans-aconitate methyltransferase